MDIYTTIFFQQVFVIQSDDSFKLYEFFYLFVFYFFVWDKNKSIYTNYSLNLFVFCLSSVIGTVINFYNEYKIIYYYVFPDAKDFIRYNFWVAPLLLFCFHLNQPLSWTQKIQDMKGKFYHDRFYDKSSVNYLSQLAGLEVLDVCSRVLLPKIQ